MRITSPTCATMLSILCLLALPAAGDSANYGDSYGTAPGEVDFLDITETSVTDPLPLFGPPTMRIGNQLLFYPSFFASQSGDDSSDVTISALTMTIVADPGYTIEGITVVELGDFLITGTGTQATYASAGGSLSASPGGSMALTFAPVPPYYGPAGGTFSGSACLDLSGQGITRLDMVFENVLSTGSELGTSAFIQKNVLGAPRIEVTVIPEPASLVLLLAGGLYLARRRRS